jgi:NAD+ synthase
VKDYIINWIKDYAEKGNFKLVIGVSGGVDSGTVSTLCANTGIETHIVTMPIYQNEEQLKLAREHMTDLQSKFPTTVHTHEYDLTHAFDSLRGSLPGLDDELGWANTRSRLRMITLYQIAHRFGGIVVGTGNKVEDFGVGFYTKYGDGGVDIAPIADLSKTEVRELAKELGVIQGIVDAKPTDGLWDDDRTDEDQIGASYEELEWAMDFKEDPKVLTGREKEVYNIYMDFHRQNKHKMEPIPICKPPRG